MNSKDIDIIRRDLFKSMSASCHDDILDQEMKCREMIMSILTYDKYCKLEHLMENSLQQYKEKLGIDRFTNVCIDQYTYFKEKCRVVENVYTDSDGLSYNSCIEEELEV